MTTTMAPTGPPRSDGSSDVRARREAALDRLNGGRARPPKSGSVGRGAARTKPSRRAVQKAEPKAVEQLGPAPAVYYAIVVIVAAFVMLGLVMVLSATSANQVGGDESPYTIFTRQLVWACLGLVGMGVALSIPYQRWRALVVVGAILAAGTMMLPFVPGVGATINDANSWVRFGSFGFQPSEILKLAAIAFLADYFARHRDQLHEPRHGIVPLALVGMACSGVSFIQGDLGSAIVLGAVVLAVGVIAGIPLVHLSAMAFVGASAAALAIMSDPRRFSRLTAFRDIEGNKEHLAWQSWQGLLGIANGGMTGSGIGGSRSKMGYLPLAHSDFIFAVVADELGFIGSVAVIGGFALLVWFGIQTALGGARPVRPGARRRHLGVVRRAGDRAHRWRGRAAPGHRAHAAVLLGGGHLAVRVDGRRRAAAQRRPACRDLAPSGSAQAGGDRCQAGRRARRPAAPHDLATTGAMTDAPASGHIGVFAVVTGGGTSGHVLPALAVAEALVASGHDPAQIHYIGARRGIETRLLPDTPFPHTFLDVVGFQRRVTRANAGFAPKMWRARREAIDAFRTLRPQVVVSVGGYASMPAVFAARALRVPLVVVSYDRFPGRASALSARRAAACAVAFPDSPLPRAVLTGAPVRQAILDVDRARDREAARSALEIPDERFLVAVVGGSQGSGVLNEAVARTVAESAADSGLAIHHVVGERFLSGASPADDADPGDGRHGLWYRAVGYEPRMPLVYAAADLLIGRGGASTVHEVAVTATPAVLVPWAGSAEDHQTANVRWLADAGAAVLLTEHEISTLPVVIDRLRHDRSARDRLSVAASQLGAVHRQGQLARLIESVAARR